MPKLLNFSENFHPVAESIVPIDDVLSNNSNLPEKILPKELEACIPIRNSILNSRMDIHSDLQSMIENSAPELRGMLFYRFKENGYLYNGEMKVIDGVMVPHGFGTYDIQLTGVILRQEGYFLEGIQIEGCGSERVLDRVYTM